MGTTETKKMRVGVVGCGAISDIYLTNMIHNFENLEVAACCAGHLEHAKKKAEQYGIKGCTYEEILADPSIEMVVILTPAPTHEGLIRQALEAGKQVAMVTLGDVSVYSTATYVRQILAEKGYATQVIAGIPSFCAGAASAQYSLCENGESLLVLPGITAQAEIEAALAQFENVVIMKAGRTLSWLLPLLQEQGLLEKTVMFRDVGMETAYVGEPKADGNSYFTTLLIKKGGLR